MMMMMTMIIAKRIMILIRTVMRRGHLKDTITLAESI